VHAAVRSKQSELGVGSGPRLSEWEPTAHPALHARLVLRQPQALDPASQ